MVAVSLYVDDSTATLSGLAKSAIAQAVKFGEVLTQQLQAALLTPVFCLVTEPIPPGSRLGGVALPLDSSSVIDLLQGVKSGDKESFAAPLQKKTTLTG
jgi:hypothetical protein